MNKFLPVAFTAIVAIASAGKSNAQGVGAYTSNSNLYMMQDRDGKPIASKEYTDVVGSPYLAGDWGTGIVLLANGQTVKDVQLKYDLKADELHFKGEKGDELMFSEPVTEFKITYKDKESDEMRTGLYRRGFAGVPGTTADSYFEVLADGSAKLLKKTTVMILTTQEWNSASKTRNFKDETKYYMVKDGKATTVKRDKKSILSVLADKAPQLEAYASANKVNFKSDADLSKLVTYYNSL